MHVAVSTFSLGISLWKLTSGKPLITHFFHLSSLPLPALGSETGVARSWAAWFGTAPWQRCSQSAVCRRDPNNVFILHSRVRVRTPGPSAASRCRRGAFLGGLEESWKPPPVLEGVWDDGGSVASDLRTWRPPGRLGSNLSPVNEGRGDLKSMNKTNNSETPELNEKIHW